MSRGLVYSYTKGKRSHVPDLQVTRLHNLIGDSGLRLRLTHNPARDSSTTLTNGSTTTTKMVDHRALTIQSLPNEVLLYVFSFHRLLSGSNNRPPAVAWRWHILAHVCQRWRDLIFGSLRHLGARLVIPRDSLKTPLNSLPALPLSIWYDLKATMSSEQKAEVVAAFEHSDRIREISLPMTMGYSCLASMCNRPFLELEHLALPGIPGCPVTLSSEFLGGSTPSPRRLRSIHLSYYHLPTLPQLLLSSQDLVSLHLGYYTLTRIGFISPEVLSTALSATTQLEYLYIDCRPVHTGSYPELTSETPSPLNLVVLPALTYFHFGSFIEYMENLVSRIHAPHLVKLSVHSDQGVLDVPQLSQFICRTERLSSLPFRPSISLDMAAFSVEHHFKPLPFAQEVSHVYFRNVRMGGWQMSEVDHICTQLSPLASSVKQLKISAFYFPPNVQRKTDPAPWLQLLTPYDSVEEVEFHGKGAPCTGIASALQQSTPETAQELLQALHVLRIRGFHTWSISLIMSFATARQLAGRPVIVRRLNRMDQDTDWEINDTCEEIPV